MPTNARFCSPFSNRQTRCNEDTARLQPQLT
uniref:Uncharacterized protein n=1 Tax=Arundo donax TaxID=35708 RepID=A0A0A8Z9M4_ARUDO